MSWNPSDKAASLTLTNLDKTVTKASSNQVFAAVRSLSAQSDKRYAEVSLNIGTLGPYITIGLASSSMPLSAAVGGDVYGWSYYQETGQKYTNNTLSTFGATYANGDIIGVAYDAAGGKVWFSKNNIWQASGDPSAGTNPAFSGLASGLFLAVSLYWSDAPAQQITGRFVSSDMTYSPPSGFAAWTDSAAPAAHRMFSVF